MSYSKIYVVYGYDVGSDDSISIIAFPKKCDAESFVNSMKCNDKRAFDEYDFEEIDFADAKRD